MGLTPYTRRGSERRGGSCEAPTDSSWNRNEQVEFSVQTVTCKAGSSFPTPAVPDHCSIEQATASSIFCPRRCRGGARSPPAPEPRLPG